MGMRPGRRRLKGPKVSGKWTAKLRRSGGDGFDSDYARSRRLKNELARDMFFEGALLGGGYHTPGPLGELARVWHEQAEEKKRLNRKRKR